MCVCVLQPHCLVIVLFVSRRVQLPLNSLLNLGHLMPPMVEDPAHPPPHFQLVFRPEYLRGRALLCATPLSCDAFVTGPLDNTQTQLQISIAFRDFKTRVLPAATLSLCAAFDAIAERSLKNKGIASFLTSLDPPCFLTILLLYL